MDRRGRRRRGLDDLATAGFRWGLSHHELFLRDASGKEGAYNLIDLDVPVREGNTVTVVWVMPENAKSGPYVEVRNHSTGDSNQIEPKRLLPWFFKKKLVWMVTIGGAIVGFIISWMVGLPMLFAPYLYFKFRALKAIKDIFASREYTQLQAQLSQVKPNAAAAA